MKKIAFLVAMPFLGIGMIVGFICCCLAGGFCAAVDWCHGVRYD